MAITTEDFPANGTDKEFTVVSEILSKSHVRVHFYYDDGSGTQTDHAVVDTDWDELSGTILFKTAPTNGHIIKITTSTDGNGLDTAPTTYSNLAASVDAIVAVEASIPAITKAVAMEAEILKVGGEPNATNIGLVAAKLDDITAAVLVDAAQIAADALTVTTEVAKFPDITVADATKVFVVNALGTGYELADASSGMSLDGADGMLDGAVTLTNTSTAEAVSIDLYTSNNGTPPAINSGMGGVDLNWSSGMNTTGFTHVKEGLRVFTVTNTLTNSTTAPSNDATNFTLVPHGTVVMVENKIVKIKGRSIAGLNNIQFDTLRGNNKAIYSNLTNAEGTVANSVTFTSTGFQLGSDTETNHTTTGTYVATSYLTTHLVTGTENGKEWIMAFNPVSGYQFGLYVGLTTAHSFKSFIGKMDLAIVKNTETITDWRVQGFGTDSQYMNLQESTAVQTSTALMGAFSDTGVILGTHNTVNELDKIHFIEGFRNAYKDSSGNVIGNFEIGTYSGNNTTTKVSLLGKPLSSLVKAISSAGSWAQYDDQRPLGAVNVAEHLYLDSSTIAGTSSAKSMLLGDSDFTVGTTSGDTNGNGVLFLYMAVIGNNDSGGADNIKPSSTSRANVTGTAIGSKGKTAEGTYDNFMETIATDFTGTYLDEMWLVRNGDGTFDTTAVAPQGGGKDATNFASSDYYTQSTNLWADSSDTTFLLGRSYIARILSSGGIPYLVESLNMVVQSGTLYAQKLIVGGNRFIVDFGTVGINSRYVMDFPSGFDATAEDWEVKAEVFAESMWSGSGWYTESTGARGVNAHANSEGIVIQTGVNQLLQSANFSGSGHGNTTQYTSLPCRVIATYVGKAKNA